MKFLKYMMICFIVVFTSIVLTTDALAEDIDQVLQQAHEALQDQVKPEKPENLKPENSKRKRRDQDQINAAKKRAADGETTNLEMNTTATLPPSEASHVLDIDLKALQREQEPQDPRFTVFFSGGMDTLQPSFVLTKDDDNFTLTGPASLYGGLLSLSTSWGVAHLFDERAALRVGLAGQGGVFSGQASVQRTGVQNFVSTYQYFAMPISLGGTVGLEFFKRFNLTLTYGPMVELISQKGTGQLDTLSGAFNGDLLDIGGGAALGKGWEAELNFLDNGVFNQNLKGQTLLLGIGYRISG